MNDITFYNILILHIIKMNEDLETRGDDLCMLQKRY